jgi:REP element-mobilizing transposase RayT
MANTYTQIHIQAVFAVKYRQGTIQKDWKDELYKYITGIVRENDHRLLAINGMPDHVHVFFGMRPTQSLSDLLQVIKANSSKWINERGFVIGRFEWQLGYCAFSYSRSEIPDVIAYIRNQEAHHQKRSLLDEYKNLLTEFAVEYDDRYIFKELE